MWVIPGGPPQSSPHSYMALESRESAQSSDLASQPPAAPTYETCHPISNLYLFVHPRPTPAIWVNLLAALTPIPPNVPLALPIQAFLFPPSTNLAHDQTLIVAVVPLGDILGERDLASDFRVAVAAAEQKAKSLLRSLARANPDTCDPGRVDQLAGPDKLSPSGHDLAYACGREFEVGYSCVAAVFGPFCFPWSCTCYSEYLFDMLEGVDIELTLRYLPWRARKTRGVEASRSDMTDFRSDVDWGTPRLKGKGGSISVTNHSVCPHREPMSTYSRCR